MGKACRLEARLLICYCFLPRQQTTFTQASAARFQKVDLNRGRVKLWWRLGRSNRVSQLAQVWSLLGTAGGP